MLRTALIASTVLLMNLASSALAAPELPKVFTDHMVLQRERPIPIWGTAAPGATVTVSLDEASASTAAGEDGRWLLELPPQRHGGPHQLVVSDGAGSVTFEDVLIGDVWLLSGQSNMAFKLVDNADATKLLDSANHPTIRMFQMSYNVASKVPYTEAQLRTLAEDRFFTFHGWRECTPTVAGQFSAVGYFFATELQKSQNVPIGLIHNAVGGSPAQGWLSRKAMLARPALAPFVEMYEKDLGSPGKGAQERYRANYPDWQAVADKARAEGRMVPHPFGPSYLYYKGIRPLVPFALRGILWYQGEANSSTTDTLEEMMSTLVAEWRSDFRDSKLPFLYVQLPNYAANRNWPLVREVQRRMLASIPNSGMAVTIDAGDPNDLHPTQKKEVGRRLALLARAKVYGETLVDSGPLATEATMDGERVVVRFASVGAGLAGRSETTSETMTLDGFEVSADGSAWSVAAAAIVSDAVVVTPPAGLKPKHVRYAWAPVPPVSLWNRDGLPASPFALEIEPEN